MHPHQASLLSRLSPYVRICHDYVGDPVELHPRVINDHAFLYYKQGEGNFVNGSDRYTIAPGSLFLIRPNCEHSFKATGSQFHMLNMHVDLVERSDSATVYYLQDPRDPKPPHKADFLSEELLPVCIPIRRTAVYERLFFCIHGLCTSEAALRSMPSFSAGNGASRIQIKSGMLELIAFLLEEVHQQKMSPKLREQLPGLQAAVRYMQAKFHRPISHLEVAKEAGMSGSYFARCFKEYYRVSPIRFLMQLRVEKAKAELALTELPVKAVAASVGFQSVHHFTRTFTRSVGISPAAYREAHGRVKK
jgi:AraC-like DNA-binding protein